MRPDAYIRILGPRNPRSFFGEGPQADPIVFIDTDDRVAIEFEVAKLPIGLLRNASAVVLRCDAAKNGALAGVRKTLGCTTPWSILDHAPGKGATLTSVGPLPPPPNLAQKCRQIEITAMVSWGDAISRPENFHYLLPSGRHAGVYVRAASILRTPSDADVLATWLLEFCACGTSSLLLDTPGLLPIAHALKNQLVGHGLDLLDTVVLTEYPQTSLAIAAGTSRLSGATPDAILACISVSSSGRLITNVRAEFERASSPMRTVTALISLGDSPAVTVPGHVTTETLATIKPDKSPYVAAPTACKLCENQKRATLVPVDGASLDAVFPSLVQRVMPFTRRGNSTGSKGLGIPEASGAEMRILWEACDSQGAVLFHAASDDNAQFWRTTGAPMGLKFDLGRLLGSTSFRDAVLDRVNGVLTSVAASPDLILVCEADTLRTDWTKLEQGLRSLYPLADVATYTCGKPWPTSTVSMVQKGNSILLFTLGGVTGGTIMDGLVGIQSHRTTHGYSVVGIVAHARPASTLAWQGVINAFHPAFASLWHTPLPDYSPFDREFELLGLADPPTPASEALLIERLEFCQGKIEATNLAHSGVFLGSSPKSQISPNSLFGQRLRGAALLAAAGYAIHQRRLEFEGRAKICKFNVSRIAQSFYDPMIFCAMLRWMDQNEVWWGDGEGAAFEVVQQLFHRSERWGPEGPAMIASELLLASSAGQVPEGVTGHIREQAEFLLQQGNKKGQAALELALSLPGPNVKRKSLGAKSTKQSPNTARRQPTVMEAAVQLADAVKRAVLDRLPNRW